MKMSSSSTSDLTNLLAEAVETDDLIEVQQLLEAGAKPDGFVTSSRCPEPKMTPLHVASRHGQQEVNLNILKRLLDGGAEPDCQDVLGRTPLSYANTPSKACLLIGRGASVTTRDY